MDFSLVEVSPALSAKWLRDHNQSNPRTASASVVKRYAKDMIDGRWGMDPNPICFGPNDELLNGQHRLLAVEESGTTQKFWVARDCPADSVFDIGKTRSTGDILQSHGVPSARKVGATVAAYMNSDNGRTVNKSHTVSSQRLYEVYAQDPMLFHSASIMPYVHSHGGCCAAYYLILKAGFRADDVRAFASMLASGEGFKGDPTYGLYHRLKDKERKWPSQVTYLVLECWNRVQSRKGWVRVTLPESGTAMPSVIAPVLRLEANR